MQNSSSNDVRYTTMQTLMIPELSGSSAVMTKQEAPDIGNMSSCGYNNSNSKRNSEKAGLDSLDDGDMGSSDDDQMPSQMERNDGNSASKKTPPPNGKKTKGRVKIKMEFIDNKLRRYTTFSKRKTGIMKKAYELSTLTGTQVMLLVASETGHVYTFATRKLQPMITSEAGKALIQTCLNSPDPPGPSHQPDQRMSATGFEETDLSYSIGDDDPKVIEWLTGEKTPPAYDSSGSQQPSNTMSISSLMGVPSPTNSKVGPTNISMQLPTAATGFTAILSSGGLSQGGALQLGALSANCTSNQNSQQSSNSHSSKSSQTLYRIAQPSLVPISGHNSTSTTTHSSSSSGDTSHNTVTVVPTTQSNLSVVSGSMVIPSTGVPTTSSNSVVPGAVMYQTAQGVVYATPTSASLPEGVIFNFGQTSALQLPQEQNNSTATQQFITIPVPVSLTAAPQRQKN